MRTITALLVCLVAFTLFNPMSRIDATLSEMRVCAPDAAASVRVVIIGDPFSQSFPTTVFPGIIIIPSWYLSVPRKNLMAVLAHEARHVQQYYDPSYWQDVLMKPISRAAYERIEKDASEYALRVWRECP